MEKGPLRLTLLASVSNVRKRYGFPVNDQAERIGNFPQALMHLAFVWTAQMLNEALEGKDAVRNQAA